MSTKWPYPREGADAFEKVKMVKRIPIVKNPRTFDLIAKFKDFPWTQDTVMAAHQLEDVLIAYLHQMLNLPGTLLHR